MVFGRDQTTFRHVRMVLRSLDKKIQKKSPNYVGKFGRRSDVTGRRSRREICSVDVIGGAAELISPLPLTRSRGQSWSEADSARKRWHILR